MSEYIFYNSWQLNELRMNPSEEYVVLMDLGDLKKGELVKFVGFDDIDNHFGIFVFTNEKNQILEVSGDFSGPDHPCLRKLKAALSKE
jgi:hypothetical protein